MDSAIRVEQLKKCFGTVTALDGVDFAVPRGTVLGLLGPNGAGKTTAVRVFTTILRPDGGVARVLGHDVAKEDDLVRTLIGLAGQYAAVDENLTGRENLRLVGKLTHLPRSLIKERSVELLERFDLTAAADRPVKTYSGGMRRRLDLAASLISRPPLIFLDEPTTGLDPRSRREVWVIVREQVADGVTVLLTTQYLDEADQLADRIGVLDGGRLVAEGTAAELKRRVPGGHVSVQFTDVTALAAAAAAHPTATTNTESLTLQLRGDGSITGLRRVLDGLDDRGVAGLTVTSADLDDVFLALTGRSAAAVAPEEVPA